MSLTSYRAAPPRAISEADVFIAEHLVCGEVDICDSGMNEKSKGGFSDEKFLQRRGMLETVRPCRHKIKRIAPSNAMQHDEIPVAREALKRVGPASFRHSSRSFRRSTLPTFDFGSSSRNSMCLGRL